MMYVRQAKGRFAKGNPGGSGRPARHVEIEYLKALQDVCSLTAWKEICKRAVDEARHGDKYARVWLSNYVLGAPKQIGDNTIELEKNAELRDTFDL